MKRCPKCKDNKVIMFDSDNDWCEKCQERFPAVAEEEDACETGCRHFHGGEIRHHKDCYFYPESFSKMYDDLVEEHESFKIDIKRIMIEMSSEILKNIGKPNIGKEGCLRRLRQLMERDFTKEPKDLEFDKGLLALRKALKDMYFAYINKDGENPHYFETYAINQYEKLFPEEKIPETEQGETPETEQGKTPEWYEAQVKELLDIRKTAYEFWPDIDGGNDAYFPDLIKKKFEELKFVKKDMILIEKKVDIIYKNMQKKGLIKDE